MIPDPVVTRLWRALAALLCTACGVLALAQTGCDASESRSAQRRIVSVGGAITETVFALGAGRDVVAVDTSSVYPPQAAALPKVGYQRTLSAEGILALSPDLVVVGDEAGPASALAQLRAAGVRVAQVPAAGSLDTAVARIVAVGAAIDRPAAALANQVRRDGAAAIARAPREGPRFVLVYARGAGTLMVSGGDTPGAAMVELAGGRNAVIGVSGWKPLSAEVLIDAAPDVIVVPARGLVSLGGEAGILAIPGISATPAGRARRIVAFDDLLLLGFGPRLPGAIDALASQLRSAP